MNKCSGIKEAEWMVNIHYYTSDLPYHLRLIDDFLSHQDKIQKKISLKFELYLYRYLYTLYRALLFKEIAIDKRCTSLKMIIHPVLVTKTVLNLKVILNCHLFAFL